MRPFASCFFVVALATPAICADFVVTKAKHVDAVNLPGAKQPAKDMTEVMWIGKDRMRTEEDGQVTIVRNDLKKMYRLDTTAKTFWTVDLPIDMKKFIPTDMIAGLDARLALIKVTVTPTTETKKIKDWNATKYTLSMTMPKGTFTEEIWATKDIAIDRGSWSEMNAAKFSASPVGGQMGLEWKKVDGFPVLIERTQKIGDKDFKGKDEVTLVEQKEPAEGFYDIPKDYTEVPFDPTGNGGAPHTTISPLPPEKPKDKPVEKPPVDKPVEKPVDKPVPH